MITNEKTSAAQISTEQRDLIGIRALSGEPVIEIADEFNIYRQFIYTQKARVSALIEEGKHTPKDPIVVLDKKMVEKIIVSCMLVCKGSIEDTQRHLYWCFGVWVSIGKISGIVKEAALKAKEWNSSIDLGSIKTGANDEIFQSNSPVLVGVDPKTTYTYMMEAAENRDSATWGYHFLEKEKNQNLKLETSVNDGGTGLIKGVKDAYPDVEIQNDVFHFEREVSKALIAIERGAYKDIENEEKQKKKHDKKGTAETKQKFEEATCRSDASITVYDKLNTLYLWILELLGIGGYFYQERLDLFKFVISEIEKLQLNNSYLQKALKFLKENLYGILYFVREAERLMEKLALSENIPVEIVRKMWEQMRYSYESSEYNLLEAEIGRALGKQYEDVRKKFAELIDKTVRASSIVECINSLIRPYLFLKRAVPGNFLALLQFYFNTREYRRSRKKDRVGKSPVELLTGKKYGNPLEILGY
jgi:hypothetical protein